MNIPSSQIPDRLGEAVHAVANAFGKRVATLKRLPVDITQIGDCKFGGRTAREGQANEQASFEMGFELTLSDLATVARDPEHPYRETISGNCSVCNCQLQVMRLFQSLTACDDCRGKVIEDDRIESCRGFWEKICPDELRDTKLDHPGFPIAIYREIKTYKGDHSLFMLGPTGKCKSRMAALALKFALLAGKTVGFIWPEELKDAAKSHDRLKLLKSFGNPDVLVMDDSLLSGAQDGKTADFLRDLLDYRMRHQRHFIITSQVGEQDYTEQGDKYGNLTSSEKEQITAIFRRIREKCKLIPFATPVPAAGSNDLSY
jgi:hypothetical protein